MKPSYLGDSYDHVKRVLIEISEAYPWVAAPLLTEKTSSEKMRLYRTFLKVEVPEAFENAPSSIERAKYFADLKIYCKHFGSNIFLDPCTGIRVASRFRASMREHVSTADIIDLLSSDETRLLCFDQSLSRGAEDQDRAEKLSALKEHSVSAFYFRSHASFLCAARNLDLIDKWYESIRRAGIPSDRIQKLDA